MSGQDDQPVTVPPPAGEDDAYSATTKVGAMPADIMERLRAEGLLPEEPPETPATAIRPSTSLERRPTPPPPAPDGAPVPQLYSTPPSALEKGDTDEDRASQSKMVTVKPPPPAVTGPPPAPASDAIETPVAFAMPPSDIPKLGAAAEDKLSESEEKQDTTALTRSSTIKKARAREDDGPSKTTLYIIAALVLVALIVALMRLGR